MQGFDVLSDKEYVKNPLAFQQQIEPLTTSNSKYTLQ